MLMFLTLALLPDPGRDAGSLADRVVAFAESKLGEKVGDGQCSALVAEALRQAGARRGGPGWEEPWGERVDASEDLRPGDVLVFRDAVFVQRRPLRNGAVRTTIATMEHHVAIVSAVQRRDGSLRIAVLHQNAGPTGRIEARRQVVQRWVIDPKELAKGTVTAHRPVPDDRPRSTPDRPDFDPDPGPRPPDEDDPRPPPGP